jgi:hypothetical protein
MTIYDYNGENGDYNKDTVMSSLGFVGILLANGAMRLLGGRCTNR